MRAVDWKRDDERKTLCSPFTIIHSKRNLLQRNVHLFAAGSEFCLNTALSTINENRNLDTRHNFDKLQATALYFNALLPQHIGSRKGFLHHSARTIVFRRRLVGGNDTRRHHVSNYSSIQQAHCHRNVVVCWKKTAVAPSAAAFHGI